MSDLEPISPGEAVRMYLNHREPELSEKSLQNHRYRLDSFAEFCAEEEIENMNDLTGRDLHRFRVWRLDDGVSKVTLRGQLATLRVFLEFAAAIDAVEQGMRERVMMPDLENAEEARDEQLDESRAEAILEYLDRFEYASRNHVIMGILWHTGIRLGSLRAFDVDDFDTDARCLDLRHRPDTGTPLKNGEAAERSIAIGDYYMEVIQDYIRHHRRDVKDEHGRNPLITSREGRYSDTSVRESVYRLTRPCMIAECPHDRDPETCEAMSYKKASECPTSRSPHAVRRGSITKHLRGGIPEEIVSDRMNVSGDVLDKHYDQRTDREKMQIRREFLEEA